MKNFDFSGIFGNDSNSTSKKRASKQRRGRQCRIEELEGREMLSATPWTLVDDGASYSQNNPEVALHYTSGSFNNEPSPAPATLSAAPPVNANPAELSHEEFNYLREEKYADLGLSASMSGYNVIVIEADNLTDANLRTALNIAGTTTKNDLIVVRTTETQNKITLTGGQLFINSNALTHGDVNIVSLGTHSLTIDANQQSRVFYIGSDASVGLAGITITNGYGMVNPLATPVVTGIGPDAVRDTFVATSTGVTYQEDCKCYTAARIGIDWQHVEGAVAYQISWRKSVGGNSAPVDSELREDWPKVIVNVADVVGGLQVGNTLSFVANYVYILTANVPTLENVIEGGSVYTFRVVAIPAAGSTSFEKSEPSDPIDTMWINITAPAPIDLKVDAKTDVSVTLSWTAATAIPGVGNSTPTSYTIEWQEKGGDWSTAKSYRDTSTDGNGIGTAPSGTPATSYTITGLDPNTEYEVRVQTHICGTWSSRLDSAWSEILTVKTDTAYPMVTAPALTANAANGKITVGITDAGAVGVASYTIRWATQAAAPTAELWPTTGLAMTVTDISKPIILDDFLGAGVTWVTVIANPAAGYKPGTYVTAVNAGTIAAPVVVNPAGGATGDSDLLATPVAGTSHIKLTWNTAADATGYQIAYVEVAAGTLPAVAGQDGRLWVSANAKTVVVPPEFIDWENGTASFTFTQLTNVPKLGDFPAYTIGQLTPGKTYAFMVVAVNGAGTSGKPTAVIATAGAAQATAPAKPTGVTAVPLETGNRLMCSGTLPTMPIIGECRSNQWVQTTPLPQTSGTM